jgi:hypothetical protein
VPAHRVAEARDAALLEQLQIVAEPEVMFGRLEDVPVVRRHVRRLERSKNLDGGALSAGL